MSEEALAAQLGLTVTGPVAAADLERLQPWLLGVARRVPLATPPALTIDVGRLVTAGPRPLSPPKLEGQDELRIAHSAYAEHLVGRVRGAAALRAVVDASATGPLASDPTPAVVAVVGRVMSRLAKQARLPASGVSQARRLFAKPAGEVLELQAASSARASVRSTVAETLRTVASAAKRVPRLLEATDAFVVRHLHALGTASDLLAFEQVVDAAGLLSARVPRRVRRPKVQRGSENTRVADETSYPVGGYAEIASHGPLENLVSSELVYLEPEAELDLFDLRYVTGELLKFVRDEGVWNRPRRTLDLVLGSRLLDLRVKVASLPYQIAVMAQGALLVLVDRLVQWLSTEALSIRVWVEDPRGDHASDAARLSIALADPIELGVVTVRTLRAKEAPPPEEGETTRLRFDVSCEGARAVFDAQGRPTVAGADPRGLRPDVEGWARALTEVALGAL